MKTLPPGLIYFPDTRPGIRRKRQGRGFTYLGPDGTRIDRGAERDRIEALAVPPAYRDVWICPDPNGHLQATGRDDRRRKQYRYHPDWTAFRSTRKYDRLADFGRALPSIRRRIRDGLNGDAGDEDIALAAVLALIDRHSIRVGNPEYADENGTFGATTLRRNHMRLDDDGLTLTYPGKGGRKVTRRLTNTKLMKVLQRLDDLPGAELATWIGPDGEVRRVTSDRVNTWIADVTGIPGASAKTFRTWNGSTAALAAARHTDRITIKAMAEAAAERLANTASIARNSYIHPDVIALTEDARPLEKEPPEIGGLRLDERYLLAVLDV